MAQLCAPIEFWGNLGVNMAELSEEVRQLKEKLHFFEQLAILGKLILCAAHELNCQLEEIESLLSIFQDKENDPATKERNLTEALKDLDKMSRTVRSLLSNNDSLSSNLRNIDTLGSQA
jgi:C4-dicarboxylate-specific signal transduction histidine kinase